MKYSRTFLIESIIEKVANGDSDRALLRRWFAGAGGKPKNFFKMVAAVADQINAQVEAGVEIDGHVRRGGDGVHIVALDTGRVVLAHKTLATQRIAEGSHRLALKADLERLKRD